MAVRDLNSSLGSTFCGRTLTMHRYLEPYEEMRRYLELYVGTWDRVRMPPYTTFGPLVEKTLHSAQSWVISSTNWFKQHRLNFM